MSQHSTTTDTPSSNSILLDQGRVTQLFKRRTIVAMEYSHDAFLPERSRYFKEISS